MTSESKRSSRQLGADGALSFLTEGVDQNANEGEKANEVDDKRGDISKEQNLHKEAGVRAEQQLAARQVMLQLADELLQGARQREKYLRMIDEEKLRTEQTQRELNLSLVRFQQVEDKLEDVKTDLYRYKFKDSTLSNSFTKSVLLWSRQALPVDQIGESPNEQKKKARLSLACTTRPQSNSTSSRPASREIVQLTETSEEAQECQSEASDAVEQRPCQESVGDSLMILWIVSAWFKMTREASRHKVQVVTHIVETERAITPPDNSELIASYERKIEEEQAKTRAEHKRYLALLDELDVWKLKCAQLERDKSALTPVRAATPEDSGIEELQRKYDEALKTISEKDEEIDRLEKACRELELQIAKSKEAWEAERQGFKAKIREVGDELQRQIHFAKHFRDSMLKSNTGGNSSISAEKFQELISELEHLKEMLDTLGSERDRAKKQAEFLRSKLDVQTRRLELERQFLPLLHKVRGPVGPKNPLFTKNMTALAAVARVPDDDREGGPPEKLKLAYSHSAGSLKQEGGTRQRDSGHRL